MLTIKRLTKKNYAAWDCFVKKANNGTIFHLRQFLSYHPDDRFIDHSIEFYKNNTLVSVFPAAESIIKGERFLVSHPGATVGSFVTLKTFQLVIQLSWLKLLFIMRRKMSLTQ